MLPLPPLLPVLLLCPFGLQLQQWSLDCWAGCVATHTRRPHCMQRVHRYRSCTSAGRSGRDQSSVPYFALPGYIETCLCVRAPVRIYTKNISFLFWSVCVLSVCEAGLMLQHVSLIPVPGWPLLGSMAPMCSVRVGVERARGLVQLEWRAL